MDLFHMSDQFVVRSCLKITLAAWKFTSFVIILNMSVEMSVRAEIAATLVAVKSCSRMVLLLVLLQIFQGSCSLPTLSARMIRPFIFIFYQDWIFIDDQILCLFKQEVLIGIIGLLYRFGFRLLRFVSLGLVPL